MKVINTFILLCYNNYGDNMKKGYIICISVLVISIIIGGIIIHSNNKLVYTKKDLKEVNSIKVRSNDINNKLNKLKKEQKIELKKNGKSKKYYSISNSIDKYNSEKADLDINLDNLSRKKVINYRGMIPGIVLIILGIISSILLFVKTRKLNDN